MADAAELVVRIRGDASDLEATISGKGERRCDDHARRRVVGGTS